MCQASSLFQHERSMNLSFSLFPGKYPFNEKTLIVLFTNTYKPGINCWACGHVVSFHKSFHTSRSNCEKLCVAQWLSAHPTFVV